MTVTILTVKRWEHRGMKYIDLKGDKYIEKFKNKSFLSMPCHKLIRPPS